MALLKNDPNITIVPTDINLIHNYILTNDERLQDSSPLFESLCLPGISESFKLHLFIYVDLETNLRFVYVCEDNNEALKKDLESSCQQTVKELEKRKLMEAIEICESDMFSKISKSNRKISEYRYG